MRDFKCVNSIHQNADKQNESYYVPRVGAPGRITWCTESVVVEINHNWKISSGLAVAILVRHPWHCLIEVIHFYRNIGMVHICNIQSFCIVQCSAPPHICFSSTLTSTIMLLPSQSHTSPFEQSQLLLVLPNRVCHTSEMISSSRYILFVLRFNSNVNSHLERL